MEGGGGKWQVADGGEVVAARGLARPVSSRWLVCWRRSPPCGEVPRLCPLGASSSSSVPPLGIEILLVTSSQIISWVENALKVRSI